MGTGVTVNASLRRQCVISMLRDEGQKVAKSGTTNFLEAMKEGGEQDASRCNDTLAHRVSTRSSSSSTNRGTVSIGKSISRPVNQSDLVTSLSLRLIGQFGVGFYSAFLIADTVPL